MKNIKKYLLFFKNYFFVKRWEPYCAPMRVVNEEETIIFLIIAKIYIFFQKNKYFNYFFQKKRDNTGSKRVLSPGNDKKGNSVITIKYGYVLSPSRA